MRVVVDANVFVSSFFGGNPRKIISLWKTGKVTLCLSGEILAEYTEVLARMGLNQHEIEELLSLFARGFNLLFTSDTPTIAAVKSDPDDDKFIECAVALKAEVVVTGDKALQKLHAYMGIKIRTPRQFLEECGRGSG